MNYVLEQVPEVSVEAQSHWLERLMMMDFFVSSQEQSDAVQNSMTENFGYREL